MYTVTRVVFHLRQKEGSVYTTGTLDKTVYPIPSSLRYSQIWIELLRTVEDENRRHLLVSDTLCRLRDTGGTTLLRVRLIHLYSVPRDSTVFTLTSEEPGKTSRVGGRLTSVYSLGLSTVYLVLTGRLTSVGCLNILYSLTTTRFEDSKSLPITRRFLLSLWELEV